MKGSGTLVKWLATSVIFCVCTISPTISAESYQVKHNCFDYYPPTDVITESAKKEGRFVFSEESARRFIMDLECDCTSSLAAIRQLQINADLKISNEPLNPYAWAAAAALKLKLFQMKDASQWSPSEAVRLAQRAAELNPPTGRAYVVLAKAQLAAGDPFTAGRSLLEATRLGAPRDESLYVRALISKQIGDISRARIALEKAIEITAEAELKAVAGIEFGDLLQREGRIDDAERQYRRAVSSQSCTNVPERRLATLLLFRKNSPAAAKVVLAGLVSKRAKVANAGFLEIINFFEWSQEFAPRGIKSMKLASLLQSSEISGDEILLAAAQFDSGKGLILNLLEAGILQNVDAADGRSNTALLIAAHGNAGEVAKELIKRGARVNAANVESERPLGLFAGYGNTEIVKLLLEKGAEFNYVDAKGDSPLSLAVAGAQIETTKLLIQRGAKANLARLLSRAALSGNLSMVHLLVEIGADVNAQDDEMPPPLVSAIFSRDMPTIRYLLDKNANPYAVFNGRNIFEWVQESDDPAIAAIFSEKKKLRL